MSEWISVRNKLPPENEIVLMTIDGWYSCCRELFLSKKLDKSLDGYCWIWRYKSGLLAHVLSNTDEWKPLPSAPEEMRQVDCPKCKHKLIQNEGSQYCEYCKWSDWIYKEQINDPTNNR